MPLTRPQLVAALVTATAVGAAGAVVGVQALSSPARPTASAPATTAAPTASVGAAPSATPSSAPSSAFPSPSPSPSPRPTVALLDVAALRRAPVPSLCGHPAGRLVGGHLPGTARGEGGVELVDTSLGDLDGDGEPEGAALLSCSRGNSVETSVHLYRTGLRPLGEVDTGAGRTTEFAATEVRITGGRLQVAGRSYDADDPRCCPSGLLVRRFRLRGGTVTPVAPPGVERGAPLTGDGWGPVRVGATYLDLARATGLTVHLETLEDGDPEKASCTYVSLGGTDEVALVGGSGRVRAVVVSTPGVRSRSGIGVGDSEQELLRTYGDRADRVDNEYTDVDDVVVRAGDGRILRFELDPDDRTVSTVHAGETAFAALVEGCA